MLVIYFRESNRGWNGGFNTDFVRESNIGWNGRFNTDFVRESNKGGMVDLI